MSHFLRFLLVLCFLATPIAWCQRGGSSQRSDTDETKIPGPFHSSNGLVKTADLLLHRYKNSVVEVTTHDGVGHEISSNMGVAVGITANGLQKGESIYIATALSLIPKNARQWIDTIKIKHYSGTTYTGRVALVDEKRNLILIKPKNQPAGIRFIDPSNERPLMDIITIYFEKDSKKKIEPIALKGVLAAVDVKAGTLAITGEDINKLRPGTAVLNTQGQLVGMLLPNSVGILSSAILDAILRLKSKTAFHPRLLNVVLGQGVLVDPNIKDAYPTIESAIEAIKQGKAPKAQPQYYIQSKKKKKGFNQVILKVSKGKYKLKKAISLPSNLSFTGVSSKETMLYGTDPKYNVIDVRNAKNVSISNFQIFPPIGQKKATLSIRNSQEISLTGNVIRSKGSQAIYALRSKKVSIQGNSFPSGGEKAIYCQKSNFMVEANSFLGKWPQALAVGKGCYLQAQNNLFLQNRISIAVSTESKQISIQKNTFLNSQAGIRFFGKIPKMTIEDNIFFKNKFSILTTRPILPKKIGRNGAWKSFAFHNNKKINDLDFIIGRSDFRRPQDYDFRLLPGSPHAKTGRPDESNENTDMGAFQRDSFLGTYTLEFLNTLEAVTGEKNLAAIWNY